MTDLDIRRSLTGDLTSHEVAAVRSILWAVFEDSAEGDGGFTELDWEHALGGVHVLASIDGTIIAHASVVPREIQVGGVPLATGYIEAVAVEPAEQGRGVGTAVMREVGEIVVRTYQLGALGTGEPRFYERLGWLMWGGRSFVRTTEGDRRTPDDDGYIMVLPTPTTPPFDIHAPISCDWRPGDVW